MAVPVQTGHESRSPGRRREASWLVGKSQPEACDTLFSTWRADGQLNEDRRWQRAKLAAEARNYGLASYLIKGLPNLGKRGQLMLDAAQKPQMMSQTARFAPADRYMADAPPASACVAWHARIRKRP